MQLSDASVGSHDHSGAAALDYVIAAETSHVEITPRTLKNEDSFAVFDSHGDAAPGLGGNLGMFHRDTRHLSLLFLTIGGVRPLLLSSTVREDNATFTCDMTNPHFAARNGGADLQHSLIHLRRQRFLYGGACHELPHPAQLRRVRAPNPDRIRLRRRFQRSVRGARRPSQAPGRLP